jgi:hypothetical protein
MAMIGFCSLSQLSAFLQLANVLEQLAHAVNVDQQQEECQEHRYGIPTRAGGGQRKIAGEQHHNWEKTTSTAIKRWYFWILESTSVKSSFV